MPSESKPRNPLLAVDAIVLLNRQLVLIERSNPPEGWALPGGFVEYDETVEDAVRRELTEETGLSLENVRQWQTFSQPDRDPRQHVVSLVFTAFGTGSPQAATDAESVDSFSIHSELPELAFDHETIIQRYRNDRFRPARGRGLED